MTPEETAAVARTLCATAWAEYIVNRLDSTQFATVESIRDAIAPLLNELIDDGK